MPELVRSIIARLRQIVGNRRHAQRYKAHLEVTLMLGSSARNLKPSIERGSKPLAISGYTRDISGTGVAIIVTTIRVGGMYLTGEDRQLRIMLALPGGRVVEIQGASVRYTQLDEGSKDTGYLIGVQIKDMSDSDRALYKAHLKELAKKG